MGRTVHYDGGEKTYEMQQTIQPGDQMWVNFAELIHSRIPDRKGNVLPADLTYGTYDVKDLGSGHGSLSVGAVALDEEWGNRAIAQSPDCCGFGAPLIDPSAVDLSVGGVETVGVDALDQCTNEEESIFTDITAWWSGNSGIATVAKGKVTGVTAGTTTANGSGEVLECFGNTEYFQQVAPSAPVTVTPSISQNQPLWYFGGAPTPSGFSLGSTTATLRASGGGDGTYGWSITSGSSIAALQGTTSGQNVTSVQIASTSYSGEEKDVTVQLQFEPSSGTAGVQTSFSLDVDSPYELVPDGVTDKGVNSCSGTTGGGTNGYKSQAIYTAQSFFGATLNNIGVNEMLGADVDDTSNDWPTATPGGLTIPGSDSFADTMCITGPTLTPRPLTPQNPLSSEKIVHDSQAWFVGSVTPGTGVEVQTDTQQYYIDHGRHLTIVSPVR